MPIINQIVSGGGPAGLYREFELDTNGKLTQNKTTTHLMDFTGMTDVDNYMLYYAYSNNSGISGTITIGDLTTVTGTCACSHMFYGCPGVTGASLPNLTTVSSNRGCEYMFSACANITIANLPSLTSANNYGCNSMFTNCYRLTSANIGRLTTVDNSGCGYMFFGCTALVSADAPFLTTIGFQGCYSMYYGCRNLPSVKLSSVTTIGAQGCYEMFTSCVSLSSLALPSITPTSFGSATSQFTTMCNGIAGITIHFPSNVQSAVERLNGYSTTAPFGATSGTVLFDLPATVTLTGADTITYTRNPAYDTQTALAWKTGAYGTTNFTPAYYTSGTTDPAVSDTIYSDDACTTAVTTISAIA